MICRDVAELTSRSLDQPLTWIDRFSLWIHTTFCGHCRHFRRQTVLLTKLSQHYFEQPWKLPTPTLSDEAKERMRHILGERGR